MTLDTRMSDRAVGAGIGAAATYGGIAYGPTLLGFGSAPALCATGLLMAAAGTLADFRFRSKPPARTARTPPPGFVRHGESPWLQALSPEEWVARSGVIDIPADQQAGFLKARLSGSLTFNYDPSVPLSDLSGLALGLLAHAFALRIADRDDMRHGGSRRILDGLAETFATIRDGTGQLEALTALSERIGTPSAIEASDAVKWDRLRRHATRETYLLGLLERARKAGGVLAPAEFLWVKGLSRPTYYALNNLGRHGFHVEGLAAMDHFAHEKLAGRAIHAPRVDGAVRVMMEHVPRKAA